MSRCLKSRLFILYFEGRWQQRESHVDTIQDPAEGGVADAKNLRSLGWQTRGSRNPYKRKRIVHCYCRDV